VGARVLWALVEADCRDPAVHGALKFDTKLDRMGIVVRDKGGSIVGTEQARGCCLGVDRKRDLSRIGAAAVRDRVGEACQAGVAARGRKSHRLRAGVVTDRPVGRIADRLDRQGLAVGVGVVGQKGRGRDRKRRVHVSDKATIIIGHRRLVATSSSRVEDDVDPVVARTESIGGKAAVAAVGVNAVAAAAPGGRGGQRPAGVGDVKVVDVDRIEAAVGVVGGDVRRTHGERNWIGKVGLLPAAGGFIDKGSASQQHARGAPQISDMCSGVLWALVEADAADRAGLGGLEPDTEFDWVRIVFCYFNWCAVTAKKAHRIRARYGTGNARSRCFQV
jgi:hypothetical protein